MIPATQPTFVVSTGRCGSTLLSELLQLHPDVLSVSELFMANNIRAFVHEQLSGRAFWRLLAKPRSPMRKILTPDTCPDEFKYDFSRSNLFCQQTLPPLLYMALPRLSPEPEVLFFELEAAMMPRASAPLAQHYRFLFEWLRQRLSKKIWVERSGASLIFVDSMARLFPGAKFLHLYRDGRETALSIRDYPPLSLLAQSWFEAKRFGVDLLSPPFRIGESRALAWAEGVLGPLQPIQQRLHTKIDVAVAGEFWSQMVLSGLKSLSALPKQQVFSLSYERLVASPQEALKEVMDFIDPTLPQADWIRAARPRIGVPRARRAGLSAAESARLEKSCAGGLAALGYAPSVPLAAM